MRLDARAGRESVGGLKVDSRRLSKIERSTIQYISAKILNCKYKTILYKIQYKYNVLFQCLKHHLNVFVVESLNIL